jgi:hypothetical protein
MISRPGVTIATERPFSWPALSSRCGRPTMVRDAKHAIVVGRGPIVDLYAIIGHFHYPCFGVFKADGTSVKHRDFVIRLSAPAVACAQSHLLRFQGFHGTGTRHCKPPNVTPFGVIVG